MPKSTKRRQARSRTPRDRILDAALALAEREGWRTASLAGIAAEAGVPLAEAYGEFQSRAGILAGLMARTDASVLAGTPRAEEGETPRDRLFEILMRRFDGLKPKRAALRAIVRDLPTDPPAALCAAPALLRSMAWMLEAAGISSVGLCGRLRSRALLLLYLSVLRVFLRDESDDLARTMAALDRGLRRAEMLLGLGRFGGPAAERAAS